MRNKETKVKSGWNAKITGIRLDNERGHIEVENPKGIEIKHNGKGIEMN